VAHYVVIGGGIVGLATAYQITREYPHATVTVLEKEDHVAAHQTGHNSGVIHAGVYYKPGSLKAQLCRAGTVSMVDFCEANGIPYQICGKLIVATDPAEVPRLESLHERAIANGLPVSLLGPEQAREYEPHVSCVAALHVASTGIVDYGLVSRTLANLVAYLVSVPILLAVCAAYDRWPSAALLWLPLVLLIEEALIVGCCLVIATLNVFYRDVQHLAGVVLTLLFYLTPVFYRSDAAHEAYRLAFTLSPIAVLVDAHRRIFFHGAAPAMGPLLLAALTSGAVCALGWTVYRRVRHDIVDAI